MASRVKGGLTEEQVRQIGAQLRTGGRAPKVALRESSSGLPAGTVGAVVRLADPAESDEFIVVRIRNDELPFTPAELEPAPARVRRPKPTAPAGPTAPARSTAAVTTPTGSTASGTPAGATGPGGGAPDPAPARPAGPGAPAVTAPPDGPGRSAPAGPTATRPSPRADSGRRGSSRRQVPRLTVALYYDERGWTVEASRGSRVLVKPTAVRPAAALRVARLLDNEQVSQAIADIAQAERDEAARRAAELRSQLAEVEAVLAGYEDI